MQKPPPRRAIDWRAHRIVPSRFPPVGPWDRIADPADFESLAEVEALTNPRIREELSSLSDWPTIPQVFVAGELVGGADIVQELAMTGQLEATLEEKLGEAWRRPGDERTVSVLDGPGLRVVPGG